MPVPSSPSTHTPGAPSGAVRRGPTRTGHISFLNCYPLYWALERTGALRHMEIQHATPDVLSDRLADGTLDLGPISLFEYLKNAQDLLLLPGLAIGCDGPVMSCNLVSSVPLADLAGRRVELGSTSRTTVQLARFLIEEEAGGEPDYRTSSTGIEEMLDRAAAAVVIGDAGLRAHFHHGKLDGYDVHDLGRLWKDRTGLPMVFAVWAVRREFAEHNPAETAFVHSLLTAARSFAGRDVPAVARHAARLAPFSGAELEEYFRSLRFDLTGEMFSAIRAFGAMAADRGLLDEVPAPELFRGRTGTDPDQPGRGRHGIGRTATVR